MESTTLNNSHLCGLAITMGCLGVEGNWSLEYSSMLRFVDVFRGIIRSVGVKLEFLGPSWCGDVQFKNTWGLSNGDVGVEGEDGEPENFIRGLEFCGATVTVGGTILIQVQRRGTAFFLEGVYVGGRNGHLDGIIMGHIMVLLVCVGEMFSVGEEAMN